MESPSTSETKFLFSEGATSIQKRQILESLEACFEHSHGESFWQNILLQVKCSFAASMISYRLEPKESDIILLPMLETLVRSVGILPNAGGDCPSFTSHLLTEDAIPKVVPGRGRNPEVDFVVHLMDDHGRTLSLVPIEAKSILKQKHMAQLCAYMFRLASTDECSTKTIIGFLIDSECVRFCVNGTFVDSVMVPRFLVSAPMPWRRGTTVEVETLAVMTSLMFKTSTCSSCTGVYEENWYREQGNETIHQFPYQLRQCRRLYCG